MSRHPRLGPVPRRRRLTSRAGFAVAFAIAACVATFVRKSFPVRVRGDSMQPTLRPGDLLAVVPAEGRPIARGAIVVVATPEGVEAVKRVVAVGGDVYRGSPIPAGNVFVVGDNPHASTDSRAFGPVPETLVRGTAVAIYWPPGRWKNL